MHAIFAIEPEAINNWHDLRYAVEKFGYINPAIKYTKSCCVGDTWMPEIRTDSLRA